MSRALAVIAAASLVFLVACSPVGTSSYRGKHWRLGGTGGGSGGTSGSTTTYPTQYPFEITINSVYESNLSGPKTQELDCQVPAGTAAYPVEPPEFFFPIQAFGGAVGTLPSVTETCTANIPEARLHYSELQFTARVGAEGVTKGCAIVQFVPYVYLASRTANFAPEWVNGSLVDCTVTPIPASWLTGIGSTIVPNFPERSKCLYARHSKSVLNMDGKSGQRIAQKNKSVGFKQIRQQQAAT